MPLFKKTPAAAPKPHPMAPAAAKQQAASGRGGGNSGRGPSAQPGTASGRGRGGGRGAGVGVPPMAQARGASPPPRGGGAPPDDAIRRKIAEIRENMMQPLGQMLEHPPNEEMGGLVDMYMGEAHANLETIQQQMMHVANDDLMMQVVALASEFHELEGRAEAWKRGGASGPSSAQASSRGGASSSGQAASSSGQSATDDDADLVEAMRLSAEAAAEEQRRHQEAARHAADEEVAMRASAQVAERQAAAERDRASRDHSEAEVRRVQEAEARAMDEANQAHQAAMRRAQEEEAAMLHGQVEADRKRKAEEAHAKRLQDEADQAERAAAAAAAAAQGERNKKKREAALAEQRRQEDIQRERHAQSEAEAMHAQREAVKQAAEEEAHAKRMQQESDAAQRAAAQAAAAAAQEHDATRRAKDLAEQHRQEEIAGQRHAQAEEERLHAEMLRRQQEGETQASREARLAEAEAMLRETLNGAGKDDVELLEYAVKEAQEAGLASTKYKKLLRQGEERLAHLRQAEAVDDAREALHEALDDPYMTAASLKEAIAQGSKAGLPDGELAEACAMLEGLAERSQCSKEVVDSMHDPDPARLRRAISKAQRAGVAPKTLKLAERNLMAVTFMTQRGGSKKSVLQAWKAVADDMRAAKVHIMSIFKGDASADAIEKVVAQAQELDVDTNGACDHALMVARQRRIAHDMVVCALVTGELEELLAAKKAVEAAGGPGHDLERLKPAMMTATEDEKILQDLDMALPRAVDKYLKKKNAPAASMSQPPVGLAPAVGAGRSAQMVQVSPVSAPWDAPASPGVPPPTASSPPAPAPGTATEPSTGSLLSMLFGGTRRKSQAQSSHAFFSGPGTRPRQGSPTSGAQQPMAKVPPPDRAAQKQDMKTKVERARQWVHSQDRAHKASTGRGPPMPGQMPNSAPAVNGYGRAPSAQGAQPFASGNSMGHPFNSAPGGQRGHYAQPGSWG